MKTIRASNSGSLCSRKLWYSLNNYPENDGEIDILSERNKVVGSDLEGDIVYFLEMDGWRIDKYNPGSQSAEIELTYPIKGGQLAGHFDCFISKGDKQNILCDIKTMNDRSFRIWKREGSIKSYPQYVDQVHIYAGAAIAAGYTVEHLAIAGFNKNNSELYVDIFDYSPERFREICERSEKILASETVPDEEPRANWCCSYCEYSGICELKASKQVPVSKECVQTDDAEIIRAIEALSQARALNKEARDLEDEAKRILDERVCSQGIALIQGGDFEFSVKERLSSRFDTTAFKKSHPELVSEFTREGKSTIYEVRRLSDG